MRVHTRAPLAQCDDGCVPFDAASVAAYREAGWWTGRTLPAELVAAAELHRDRVALTTAEVSWTYAELVERAAAFGAGLARSADVSVGDAVMFQLGNVAETVVAYLGCLLAGARPVCTLPQHGVREVGLLAAHTGARALISQGDFRDGRLIGQAQQLLVDGAVSTVVLARGSAAGCLDFYDVLASGVGAELAELPFHSVAPESIAVFQLSGGTTGLPKVAPRLQEEYAYNSRAWAEAMDYRHSSVLLYPLPVMHNAGISLAVQPAILAGARLVLAETADVELLLDWVEREQPDVLPLVPPALAVRLLGCDRARSADLSCVREFVVGGQKLPVGVAERLRDELGLTVRQMFGMAEGMFTLTPRGADESVGHHTVGAPISAGDELRVLGIGTEDEVADGEVGELAARGPYTIRGYYRADAHNAATFTSDGFYRTGDLARRHPGGWYSIDGRIKDVINRGVEKIHAEEVEELIVLHPAVRTAALVAMPDPVLGERVCAYLVLDAGTELTVSQLGEFLLAQGLAKYKLPERIEVVAAFPLTNVGKVSKKDLREDIATKLEKEGTR